MKSMGIFSALKDIMDFTEKLGGLIAHIATLWIGIPFCEEKKPYGLVKKKKPTHAVKCTNLIGTIFPWISEQFWTREK